MIRDFGVHLREPKISSILQWGRQGNRHVWLVLQWLDEYARKAQHIIDSLSDVDNLDGMMLPPIQTVDPVLDLH